MIMRRQLINIYTKNFKNEKYAVFTGKAEAFKWPEGQ